MKKHSQPESEVVMTDNEIIKALEHCKVSNCLGCPCHSRDENCLDLIAPKALDLINRQQAEIERLTDRNVELWGENRVACKKAKSEAIKEFAERLKEKAYLDGAVSITQELVVDVRDVDDLAEEMCKTPLKKLEKMCGKDEEK